MFQKSAAVTINAFGECLAEKMIYNRHTKSLNIPKALFGYYEGYDELKLCISSNSLLTYIQDSAFQPLVLPSLMTSRVVITTGKRSKKTSRALIHATQRVLYKLTNFFAVAPSIDYSLTQVDVWESWRKKDKSQP